MNRGVPEKISAGLFLTDDSAQPELRLMRGLTENIARRRKIKKALFLLFQFYNVIYNSKFIFRPCGASAA